MRQREEHDHECNEHSRRFDTNDSGEGAEKNMKPEEINKAIAEKCGWKYVRITDTRPNVRDDWPSGKVAGSDRFHSVPAYYNSLDACAEFERTLDVDITSPNSPRYAYARELYTVCGQETQPFRATAPQRCEAFLRMHNLWKEEK